jgi:glycine/D-amino acid oxidase-like deaminating enzyme
MPKIDKQVIILGSGCAALWLLYELSMRGYETILLDHHPIGKFASTRNQSWLHTGALYATIEAESLAVGTSLMRTAQACKAASERIKTFCKQHAPRALEDNIGCLFLFKNEDQGIHTIDNLKLLNIPYRELGQNEIVACEPELFAAHDQEIFETGLQYGVETADVPFDSYHIMNALALEAARAGGQFMQSACELKDLQFAPDGDSWEVEGGRVQIRTQMCICATGAMIPHFSDRASEISESRARMEIQKCVVGVLHKRICNRILVFRTPESGFLNLVPFRGGTTVNMGASDQSQDSVLRTDIPKRMYRNIAEALARFTPGIRYQLPIGSHFYVCQKIRNVNDTSHPADLFGIRHYFWREDAPNFFVFYPGKFTLAPIAAREMCEHLTTLLRPRNSIVSQEQSSDPFSVSARPYYDDPSHVLDTFGATSLHFLPFV